MRTVLAFCSAASLLLCVGAALLWVRSNWRSDRLTATGPPRGDTIWSAHAESECGSIDLELIEEIFEPADDPAAYVRDSRGEYAAHVPGMTHDSARASRPPPPAFGPNPHPLVTFRYGEHGHTHSVVGKDEVYGVGVRRRVLTFPHWVVVVAFTVAPAARLAGRRRRRRRAVLGLCTNCGYDLRATPGRCPECGAAAAALLRPARDASVGEAR